MSGSGDEEVRVTISADSAEYVSGTKAAAQASSELATSFNKLAQTTVSDIAKRMAQAMRELNNDMKAVNPVWLETGTGAMRLSDAMKDAGKSLRSLTPEMLGMGSSTNAMFAAVAKATEKLRDFSVDVQAVSTTIDRLKASQVVAAQAAAGVTVSFESALSKIVATRVASEQAGSAMRQMAASFGATARAADDGTAAANRFVQALNPSNKAMLRTLFNGTAEEVEKLRASLVRVTTPMQDLLAKLAAQSEAASATRAQFQDLTAAFAKSGSSARLAGEDYSTFWNELGRTTSSQAELIAKMNDLNGALDRDREAARLAALEFTNLAFAFAQSGTAAETTRAEYADFWNDLGRTQSSQAALIAKMNDLNGELERNAEAARQAKLAMAGLALEFARSGSAAQTTRDEYADFWEQLDHTTSSQAQLIAKMNELNTELERNAEATRVAKLALAGLALEFARSGSSARLAGEDYSTFWNELGRTTSSQAELIAKMNDLDGTTARNATVTRMAAAAAQVAATATRMFGLEIATTARGSLQFNIGVKSAADSAAFFAEQLDGVQDPLQKMRTLMGETEPAANNTAHAVGGITREFIVLGREAMVGDWTRIPGTLLALSERAGGLTTAIGELVAAMSALELIAAASVLALAATFAVLIERAHEANVAVREAMNAATMQGRDPVEAKAQMEAYGASMRDVGVVGTVAMAQITSAISQLSEVTDAQKQKIAEQGTALFLNWGKDAGKTSEQIKQIYGSTAGLESYLDKEHLLSTTQQQAWAGATTAAQKYDIGIQAISDRLGNINAQAKQMQADARTNMLREMAAGAEGSPVAPELEGKGNLSGPQDLGDFQPGTKQADPQQSADIKTVIELNKHNQELVDLKAKLAAAQRAETAAIAANDPVAAKNAQDAEQAAQTQIDMWKQLGDASWAAKQNAALSDILTKLGATATSSKQLAEDENKARITFWENAAKEANLTEQQITQAHANANKARLDLDMEQLHGGEAGARKTLQDQLAALNEQQAANRDNYAKVMEIEQQKINLLKASGASATKLLEEELRKEDDLRHAHAALQGEIASEGLAKERAADNAEFEQRKASLDEQVTEGKLSKAKELLALEAFYDQQKAMEMQALQALLATLPQESKAYQTTLDTMSTLKAQWLAKDQQMNAQILADHKATWDKMTAPVESAMTAQINPVLRGTETIRQAELKMAQSIVLSYIDMGAKAALAWASSQAMQILWTGTGEAAKTAATAAGATARTGIAQTETAAANTGILARLARWIAMELGLTSATTAQTATRTATSVAADTAALSATGATNVAEGMSYAATGAAAAGASVAAIPVTGWSMAPGVAATTYAELSGFASMASLAVGAWKLPSDMPANLHAGEMVVPASFAEGVRGAMGKGASGGNSQTLNYAPNIRGGGGDMSSMMRSQSAQFKSYLWHATRNGALNLPNGR